MSSQWLSVNSSHDQLVTCDELTVWQVDYMMSWLNDFDETTDILSWLYDAWFVIVVYIQYSLLNIDERD